MTTLGKFLAGPGPLSFATSLTSTAEGGGSIWKARNRKVWLGLGVFRI